MDKVIAIDGPSGSGKSTIAQKLAELLNITYVNTGAMYRALGHYFEAHAWKFEETAELSEKLKQLSFEYAPTADSLVIIDGEDLTLKIREHRVSKLASQVSSLPSVRKYLLQVQRNLAKQRVCLMEGRDIGTVVFPKAFVKFFVTASPEVRAQRRLMQLRQAGEKEHSFDEVLADVKTRDEKDSERKIAPLRQAEDAILVDTSEQTIEEVLQSLSEKSKAAAKRLGLRL